MPKRGKSRWVPWASRSRKDPWPRSSNPLSWWRDHYRIGKEACHFVSARIGTSLLVWLLVGIALALPAGLFLLQFNLSGMTEGWDGRPGLSVYFELQAEGVDELAAQLRARDEIQLVKVTTQAEALAEFQANTHLADALAGLETNPLPASLRATLVLGTTTTELDLVADFARGAPGVDEVVVEKTWLERVADISRVVNRLGVVLGVLFGIGAVLVTSTSVRLAIEARLEELRVLKLVGASDSQIRRPFLYFGALYGLGGGLVAAMLISLGLVVIETPLTNLLGSFDQDLQLAGFDPRFLAVLLGFGGILGVSGAILAARQRLRSLEIL